MLLLSVLIGYVAALNRAEDDSRWRAQGRKMVGSSDYYKFGPGSRGMDTGAEGARMTETCRACLAATANSFIMCSSACIGRRSVDMEERMLAAEEGARGFPQEHTGKWDNHPLWGGGGSPGVPAGAHR